MLEGDLGLYSIVKKKPIKVFREARISFHITSLLSIKKTATVKKTKKLFHLGINDKLILNKNRPIDLFLKTYSTFKKSSLFSSKFWR